MENYVLIAILLVIVALAGWYIIKSKKSGKKCIGCPEGCCTPKKEEEASCCCCGCGCDDHDD